MERNIKEQSFRAPLFFILIVSPLFTQVDSYLSGITAAFVTMLSAIVGGIMLIFRKNSFSVHWLDLILFLFIICYGGLTLFRGTSVDWWNVIQALSYLILYFWVRNHRSDKTIFLLLFCSGLIQAGWAVLQILNLLPTYHYFFTGTGSFSNPALLGIFLVISFLAGMALFHPQLKFIAKLSLVTGLLLLVAGIILSHSRASWLALFCGCLWLLFIKKQQILSADLNTRRQKAQLPKRVLLAVFVLVLLCTVVYGLYVIRPASAQGRMLIWQVIVSQLPNSPWIGHGPLQALYMPAQAEWFKTYSDPVSARLAGNNIYAFNEFLRITFETGITGLLLFIVLLITGGRYVLKGNRLSQQAGSLLLAIICFGLFSYPFSNTLLLMISLIALAMIVRHTTIPPCFYLHNSLWLKGITLFLLGVFLICTIKEFLVEKQADRLLTEAQQNPATLTGDTLPKQGKHLQGNPDFMLCYGKTLFNHKLYKEALPILEQAYRLKPSSELVRDLGHCYQSAQRYSEAENVFLQAAYMTPAYILPQYDLFCLYRETGKPEKAGEKARYMLSMPVKVVNTSVLRCRAQARNFLKNLSSSKSF